MKISVTGAGRASVERRIGLADNRPSSQLNHAQVESREQRCQDAESPAKSGHLELDVMETQMPSWPAWEGRRSHECASHPRYRHRTIFKKRGWNHCCMQDKLANQRPERSNLQRRRGISFCSVFFLAVAAFPPPNASFRRGFTLPGGVAES